MNRGAIGWIVAAAMLLILLSSRVGTPNSATDANACTATAACLLHEQQRVQTAGSSISQHNAQKSSDSQTTDVLPGEIHSVAEAALSAIAAADKAAAAAERAAAAADAAVQALQRTGSSGGAPASAAADSPPLQASTFSPDHVLLGSAASARLYSLGGHEHLAADDLPPEGLAPLTSLAQRTIFERQHPHDCSAAKFLVTRGHTKGNGIGSIMHVIGYHLAVAVEKGMVLLLGEATGEDWTDEATCGHERNWYCFFRSWSNCSLADLRGNGDLRNATSNWGVAELHHDFLGVQHTQVPSLLDSELQRARPGMGEHQRKFWWRAQSVAYLMRLNERTINAVRTLRTNRKLHAVFPESSPLLSVDLAAGIPLPSGVIHAHIRHGDKYTEMALQEASKYVQAARHLAILHPFTLRQALFVSTEDDAAIDAAQLNLTINGHDGESWALLHTRIPRANTGPLAQVVQLGADTAGQTTRNHLLQLLMSLESDAWVGTLGSNWNRLLFELRCVWVPKCTQPYVEVGTEESWAEYNW